MSKIDEIKNDKNPFDPHYGRPANMGFNKGFDACMELNLPAKFAMWIFLDHDDIGNAMRTMGNDEQELFTYWLENVYQKEGK